MADRVYNYYDIPTPHFIIENAFTDEVANDMFKEVMSLKDRFEHSYVPDEKYMREKKRTNTVLYVDDIYGNKRQQSKILSGIDSFLSDKIFTAYMSTSSSESLRFLRKTNTHETQISRYGDKGQRYEWHSDSGNDQRILTAVYYFNNPKKWTGGEIELANTPTSCGYILNVNDAAPIIKTITPIPNSFVVFEGNVSHRVRQTNSPLAFEDGRFSANIWVGMR